MRRSLFFVGAILTAAAFLSMNHPGFLGDAWSVVLQMATHTQAAVFRDLRVTTLVTGMVLVVLSLMLLVIVQERKDSQTR